MSQAHHPLQAPAPLKWPNWYLTGLKFAVLLLLSPVLAGTGAWFAAGTATKSLVLRTVAALVWIAAPSR